MRRMVLAPYFWLIWLSFSAFASPPSVRIFGADLQEVGLWQSLPRELIEAPNITIRNVNESCEIRGQDLGRIEWRGIATFDEQQQVVQIVSARFEKCHLYFGRTGADKNFRLLGVSGSSNSIDVVYRPASPEEQVDLLANRMLNESSQKRSIVLIKR